MPALPTIAVVVPSLNRLDSIPPLVENYVSQGADEIIVVLDGPHAEWQAALRATITLPGVLITELPANGGLALARVAGLKLAHSDIVLLADDDVVPRPGHLEYHRAFHAANPGMALLGYMPVAKPKRRRRDQAATFVYARDYENQVAEWRGATSDELLESFWGGNASVPRELYLRAEAFKPSRRLNYNEDLDLGLRLKALGTKATFDDGARADHYHYRGFDSFQRECIVRGVAVADMEKRWPELPGRMNELIEVPSTQNGLVASVQRRIGARDEPGRLELLIRLGYRVSGGLHLWRVQDALARLVRRGLAMRGYRLATSGNEPNV